MFFFFAFQSYFYQQENIFSGLSLNRDSVTIRIKYEQVLRFYGYNLDTGIIVLKDNSDRPKPTTTIAPKEEATTMAATTVGSQPSTMVAEQPEATQQPNAEPADTTVPVVVATTTESPKDMVEVISELSQSDVAEITPPSTEPDTPPPTTDSPMPETTASPPTTTGAPEAMPAKTTTAMAVETEAIPLETTTKTPDDITTTAAPPDTTTTTAAPPDTTTTAAQPDTTTVVAMTTMPAEAIPEETTSPPPPETTVGTTDSPTTETLSVAESRVAPIVQQRANTFIYTLKPETPRRRPLRMPAPNRIPKKSKRSFPSGHTQDYSANVQFMPQDFDQMLDEHNHIFYVSPTESVQAPFKTYNTILRFAHVEALKSSVLELPLDSDNYNLLLLLPDQPYGLDSLVATMASESAPSLRDIRAKLKPEWIQAMVPKFNLEGNIVLTGDLMKVSGRLKMWTTTN